MRAVPPYRRRRVEDHLSALLRTLIHPRVRGRVIPRTSPREGGHVADLQGATRQMRRPPPPPYSSARGRRYSSPSTSNTALGWYRWPRHSFPSHPARPSLRRLSGIHGPSGAHIVDEDGESGELSLSIRFSRSAGRTVIVGPDPYPCQPFLRPALRSLPRSYAICTSRPDTGPGSRPPSCACTRSP